MQSYIYLNWRTDFEADDVFSQKSAIHAHIHRIRTNKKSFVDGKTDIQEDEDEDIVAGSILTECGFDLTAARPLAPAEPGDVCMWAGNSIHWYFLVAVPLIFPRSCGGSLLTDRHYAFFDR